MSPSGFLWLPRGGTFNGRIKKTCPRDSFLTLYAPYWYSMNQYKKKTQTRNRY